MTKFTFLGTAALVALLAGCGSKDVRLPGERLDIRDGLASAPVAEVNEAREISLGQQVANADWTHRGGNAAHSMPHLALSATPTLAFAANIGEGESRRARITADPVVAGDAIYTMDAATTVTATGTNGATLWSVDLTPAGEGGSASGGGLAVDGNRLVATTGYGEVISIDRSTGGVIWRQTLDASGATTPTVSGNFIYVVGHDNRGWAIQSDNGLVKWTVNGAPSNTSYGSGPGVAVTDRFALMPFAGGELVAAFRDGGLQRWSAFIGGERLGRPLNAFDGLSGGPVVSGDTIYLGNSSGMTIALDAVSGDRKWSAHEGAVGPVWPVGGSVFAVNDLNQLVRLDNRDGSVIWRVALPDLIERRAGKSRSAVAHYGPILAGGRLIVASSDGLIRQFDPVSGALVGQIEIPSGAASAPVVAGNTLYVVSKNGQLLAFR